MRTCFSGTDKNNNKHQQDKTNQLSRKPPRSLKAIFNSLCWGAKGKVGGTISNWVDSRDSSEKSC